MNYKTFAQEVLAELAEGRLTAEELRVAFADIAEDKLILTYAGAYLVGDFTRAEGNLKRLRHALAEKYLKQLGVKP